MFENGQLILRKSLVTSLCQAHTQHTVIIDIIFDIIL